MIDWSAADVNGTYVADWYSLTGNSCFYAYTGPANQYPVDFGCDGTFEPALLRLDVQYDQVLNLVSVVSFAIRAGAFDNVFFADASNAAPGVPINNFFTSCGYAHSGTATVVIA